MFMCDNSDKHEAARNRKFTSWFNRYADHSTMEIKSASIEEENCSFYLSIIYCKNMENATEIAEVFQTSFDILRTK